jgi:hypothetical protein
MEMTLFVKTKNPVNIDIKGFAMCAEDEELEPPSPKSDGLKVLRSVKI